MQLPENDFILLSLVNTKLRDSYSSLSELCEEEDADKEILIKRLAALGYAYDSLSNSFKPI